MPYKNNRPGLGLYCLFLVCHPEVGEKQAKSISQSRGQIIEAAICGWFRDVEFFYDKIKLTKCCKILSINLKATKVAFN